MDYKKMLDRYYEEEKSFGECAPETKLEFIGRYIFDFTTDDSAADELLAKKMIEVIDNILKKSNYEYIKNEENYMNYLTMINMPFLINKIEYGTSIRGAWFDSYGEPYEMGSENFIVPRNEINSFMQQLVEWAVT